VVIKENLPWLKPFFIAFFWTIAVSILPIALHDKSLEIIIHPETYLSTFYLIASSSNIMDIVDYEEDKKNGLETIPVKYGKYVGWGLSFVLFGLFIQNIHLSKEFQDNISHLHNIVYVEHTIGIYIIKFISSFLPMVDKIGHNVLQINKDLINNVVDNPHINNDVKSFIILSFIKMAQTGDNFGSFLLQFYNNFFEYCFCL
jgi:hypothetical protein